MRSDYGEKLIGQSMTLEEVQEYFVGCAERITAYLLKHEKALKNFITSAMQPTFIEMFVRQDYEDTVKCLQNSIDDGVVLFAPAEQIASMLIGGVSHSIVHWFGSNERGELNQLIESISTFVLKVLS